MQYTVYTVHCTLCTNLIFKQLQKNYLIYNKIKIQKDFLNVVFFLHSFMGPAVNHVNSFCEFVACYSDPLYTVQCTLYSVHCTVYIVQCTLYSVHCIVYTVQFTDSSSSLIFCLGFFLFLINIKLT